MVGGSHHLESLERLARERGIDTRATVLRVAADLFAAASNRTPGDIEVFAALALPLLNVADYATRMTVAQRLSPLPDTPTAIIERLLADDVEIAREVLLRCPKLTQGGMRTIAMDGGLAEVRAVAERSDLDSGTLHSLSTHTDTDVLETLLANTSAQIDVISLANIVDRARSDSALARRLLQRADINPAACAGLYDLLDEDDRARVRAALKTTPLRALAPLDSDALHGFRLAVLRGGTDGFVSALSRLLRAPLSATARLLDDETGELAALALIAAGCTRDETVAALLICAPETVRTSIQKIFAAASLHDDTPREVALAIIRALLPSQPVASRPAHQPHFDPAEPVSRPSTASRKVSPAMIDWAKAKNDRTSPRKG